MEKLIEETEAYVKAYMNHYDASHNYRHIQRVRSLALQIEHGQRLLTLECRDPSEINSYDYDTDLIILASLLHDIGDKKYATSRNNEDDKLIASFLIEKGASEELAKKVERIATHVSYSSEVKDPQRVIDTIAQIPELAIVQDADRLDALGAVGIGRTFTFGGARGRELEETIQHFEDKLENLEARMKTETGRTMAKERTRRIKEFRSWWVEETTGAAAL
ncbi:hypothetical protein MMC31_007350 [Peltigera leucophlebia]|nr:hypothetical protein [Peltigera leucophlebia]